MSYVAFAWIATIVYGFETIITKITSNNTVKNPWLFNLLWNILFALFMIPFYFNKEVGIPQKWGNLIITSALCAVCCIFYVYLIFRIDVSVLSPMYYIRTGFSVLFSFLILGETFSSYKLFLIGIIIIMGLFVSYDEHFSLKSFLTKNIVIVLVFMTLLSLYGIFLNKTIGDIGFWNATVWVSLLNAIFLLFTFPKAKNDLKKMRMKQWIPLFIVAITTVVGNLAANKAYEVNVGITTVIMSIPTSMIMVFLMSFIWPKLMEKHSLKIYAVRFAAASIMFICAIKLS